MRENQALLFCADLLLIFADYLIYIIQTRWLFAESIAESIPDLQIIAEVLLICFAVFCLSVAEKISIYYAEQLQWSIAETLLIHCWSIADSGRSEIGISMQNCKHYSDRPIVGNTMV